MTIKERFAELGTYIQYHDNEVAALVQCQKTVVTQIVTHGDFDGVASAALLAKKLGLTLADLNIIFTQPFLVDQVKIPEGIESVHICDLAINNRDPNMTKEFIKTYEPMIVSITDHHVGWKLVLVELEKYYSVREAPVHIETFIDESARACAEIIGTHSKTMEWIVNDAIVADTREGTMSPTGQMIEDAMKADLSNDDVKFAAVKFMMGDESQRITLENAARKYAAVLDETLNLIRTYDVDEKPMSFFRSGDDGNSPVPGKDYTGKIAVVDARKSNHRYDLTQLLLAGQKLATFAIVKTVSPHTEEEMVTIATKSGVNLVDLFDLGSGAPFRVTLPIERFDEVIEKLGEVAV